MSRRQKLIQRLCSSPTPKDITWDELVVIMTAFGFRLQNGDGSARRFIHKTEKSHAIRLHEPHNRKPPTVLQCYIANVVERLREWGYL
jgi:hypothetical protein